MRNGLAAVAAIVLIASPALAEPKERNMRVATSEPRRRVTEVVLASAEPIHASPDSAQPASAPSKRRVARITTCRCGDPQADPESQDQ